MCTAKTLVASRWLRRGYTLPEFLVILVVLVFLGGLLLVGLSPLGGVRTPCSRTQCLNNQHQISLGLIRYEFDHQFYPGWAVNQNPDANGYGGREAGWAFALTPYLDRKDIHDWYGAREQERGVQAAAPEEILKVLQCPLTYRQYGGLENFPAGRLATSYVVNTGYYHDAAPYRDRAEHSAVGVFTYQYRASASDVRTRLGAGAIADGLPQTLMLTENAEAGTWLGRAKTGDKPHRVEEGCIGFASQGSAPIPAINAHLGAVSDCTSREVGPGAALPRPSSRHSGGVLATFCDGHTQFLQETIDPSVYQRLCTPRRAIVDFDYQPMEPQDTLPENWE